MRVLDHKRWWQGPLPKGVKVHCVAREKRDTGHVKMSALCGAWPRFLIERNGTGPRLLAEKRFARTVSEVAEEEENIARQRYVALHHLGLTS